MNARRTLILMTLVLTPLFSSGCIIIAGGWGCGGTCIWTEKQTEQISLHAAPLRSLDVKTHNGAITFEAQPAGSTDAFVEVTKRTGGFTRADAENAMASLEVFAEPSGDGTKLGYRWKGLKAGSWSAQVSFDIKAPGQLDFSAESHNGAIKAGGVAGNVEVLTHNGSVNVDAEGGILRAETHNGPVHVAYSGASIIVTSHNGGISADLTRCAAVNGSLTTHNGSIDMIVGDSLSTRLECRTHNGSIVTTVPMNSLETHARRVVGTLGNGEGQLEVTTHNGAVKVKKSAG